MAEVRSGSESAGLSVPGRGWGKEAVTVPRSGGLVVAVQISKERPG